MAAGKKNTVYFEDASPKLAIFTAIMAAWRTAVRHIDIHDCLMILKMCLLSSSVSLDIA